jgi:hypothetical protein
MGYNQIKSWVGWIIIIGHLLLAVIAFARLRAYLTVDEIVGVLGVMSPITLAYMMAVVRHWMGTPFDRSLGKRVNKNFAGVVVLLPTVLIVAIGAFFFLYGGDVIANPSQLQRWVTGVEALLGSVVGFIVADLFPTKQTEAE